MKTILRKNQTVLFQGDSITDCERVKDDKTSLGVGYAHIVASIFALMFPSLDIRFVNRGINGNRVIDLLNRYDEDFREIQPDFLSVLIGINDTWHDSQNPTGAKAYEEDYSLLLEKIKKDMPDCKIMIMEPFLINSFPDYMILRDGLDPKIQIARKLAMKYADYYLPLDGIFAKAAAEEFSYIELAADGVHPTAAGHSIIAGEYLKVIGR